MKHRRLITETKSAVSVLLAGSVVPLIGLIGLAVDFGFWNQTKAQFTVAADVAALNATKIAANGIISIDPPDLAWQTQAVSAGRNWFKAALGKLPGNEQPAVTVNVARTATTVTATVSYSAAIPAQLAGFFGISQLPLSGQASSTVSFANYANITLLLDNSSSMMIGATAGDIANMQAYTPCSQEATNSGQPVNTSWISPPTPVCGSVPATFAPCAFACHNQSNTAKLPNGLPDYTQYDYYYLARHPEARPPGTYGGAITLRFDVVQQAVQSVVTTMQQSEVEPDEFTLGVYAFNQDFTPVFPKADEDPADLSRGLAATQAMTTPQVPNAGDTNFPQAMLNLNAIMTQAGDGSTQGTPAKNLFIVTDGIQDYGAGPARVQTPINPADCAAIKAKNISIYVLYTTYTPLPNNPWYVNNIAPYLGEPNAVQMALRQCASSEQNFYQASSPDDIKAALLTMLKAAIRAPARFTM